MLDVEVGGDDDFLCQVELEDRRSRVSANRKTKKAKSNKQKLHPKEQLVDEAGQYTEIYDLLPMQLRYSS